MPDPFTTPRVCRRFKPSFGSNDVRPAIPVHISGADAVSVAFIAHDVFDELSAIEFIPGERSVRISELGKYFICLAVVVQIDQESKLNGETFVDGMLDPDSLRTGISPPAQGFSKPGTAHNIHAPIAIHVNGEIAEIVHVSVCVRQLPEFMGRPTRPRIPILA